ncbi:hypothetical protein BLA60_04745 [Actinophytocola xinjiangensis]|uniref:Carrier domain-containing protein n=1 Tax=Actinophytocola xinjiangensis TaxID=485602 RepID=A0A7Z0WSC0_9PSEU|nr:non-ribosomal peptide synthetase [Actinophytocola xinjiangensis]OLF14431.1 hypothetical protein BLA60_04745 [Actinophytocola xinjiangensis]
MAEPAPLAHQQHRVWLLDRLDPGNPAFNVPFGTWLRGPLDRSALAGALTELAGRHEALRTSFVVHDTEPVMVVSPPDLPLTELAAATPADALDRAAEVARHRFDLAAGPPALAAVISVPPDRHLLVLVVHHIVCDGWSGTILLRDLGALYSARVSGVPARLPAPAITPSAYARRQRSELSGQRLRDHLDFWTGHLAGAPPVIALPTDAPRAASGAGAGAIHRFTLDADLTERVRRFARQHRATPFLVLYTAFGALLHRYSGQDRVVVGFPMANRTDPELESLVAYVSNVLPMCLDFSDDPGFADVLTGVRSRLAPVYEYQDVPFPALVAELGVPRDLGVNPIFQVHFALQWFPGDEAGFTGLEVAPAPLDNRTAKFDLYLSLEWASDGMRGELQYDADQFTGARASAMAGHYTRLLHAAVTHGGTVATLPLLTDGERDTVARWSGTGRDTDAGPLVPDLFAARAARCPSRVALVDGDRRMTFGELEANANRLAHRLRRMGVGPERIVGVCLDRSASHLVALLAVLKAGGAYLPLDPHYPPERLAFMVRDSSVTTVVTDTGAAHAVPPGPATLTLDELDLADEPVTPVHHGLDRDNLMSVLYTSGSTGRPKGVLGTHRNWLPPIAAMHREFPFRPGEVCCQKTPASFVDAVWESLDPLLHGVPLVVLPDGIVRDPSAFVAALAEHRVTRLVAVPSLLRLLLDAPGALPDLTLCVSSGEELTPDLARRLRTRLPAARLVNLYGTTEVAADVTRYTVPDGARRVAIGGPIAGARLHLLDRALGPVPVGVPGEIHVGGEVVARGYLGAPGLTAERFVPSPFGDGERLYRTGDLGRYRPDGVVELLGRADRQVKVRGVRVELGEVASTVAEFGSVADCAVLVRTELGDTQLLAYVLPAPGRDLDPAALDAHLRARLPSHLVPTIVPIAELPLLPNGKVDTAALAATGSIAPAGVTEYVAPRGREEAAMAAIWQRVLGVDRVGVHDNFFDLGGDSVRALRLVALANQEGFRLQAQDPVRSQTVAELVAASGATQDAAKDTPSLTVAASDLDALARLITRRADARDA